MFINIFTFLVILILIFVNGLTDATNAISTLVGTKVINYRKACVISAIFDMLGIVSMYYINNSIVNCVSEIANFNIGEYGITALCTGIVSAIIFSLVATLFGMPTSESHGLISGITGAGIAIRWKNKHSANGRK